MECVLHTEFLYTERVCACVCVCVCVCTMSVGMWRPSQPCQGQLRRGWQPGENDDDEIKIPRPAEGAAAIPLAAVRIDLFQHLTFNHDKTVGKLIVLQDIRHQSPLILSGAPRRMNTNRLPRQPSHPLLPFLFLLSFPFLILLLLLFTNIRRSVVFFPFLSLIVLFLSQISIFLPYL